MENRPLYVAILWHMHQPPYHLKSQGQSILPWARLHAIKDYYDMPAYLNDFDGLKFTINMVPSLIEQILLYEKNQTNDYFLTISERDADELTIDEKAFILLNFFSINVEKNIKPYPRYYELYQKRGLIFNLDEARRAAYSFTVDEFRDIQVWFNLVWCGRTLRKDRRIRYLFDKGGAFTEDEKMMLLSSQKEIIGKIIPLLIELQNAGKVEITTSPYNHPICPLLCDTRTAKTSDPTTTLPNKIFHHPEDAIEQLKRAVEFHEKIFGRKPNGVWPPEASVSESTISIFADNDIKWFVTDEDIFRLSVKLSIGDRAESFLTHLENFYSPYKFHKKGKDILCFFRDKRISNRISFDYYAVKADDAVADLMGTLTNIRKRLPDDGNDYLVTIAMDGENAWEYFDENGEIFLTNLYKALTSQNEIVPVTFSEFLEMKTPKIRYLDRIYPGSWINSNFKTWIGSEEKNKAWEMLTDVRDELEKYKDKSNWNDAYDSILKAEASDWFWWYADGNITTYANEFDYLFRGHLKDAYISLGLEPPSLLEETLVREAYVVQPSRNPTRFFSPSLDGESGAFYEWSSAGYYDAQKFRRQNLGFEFPLMDKIYFGFNKDTLFLRAEFRSAKAEKALEPETAFVFEFVRPRQIKIMFKRNNNDILCEIFMLENGNWKKTDADITCAVKDVIEIGVPFSMFGAKAGENILFFMHFSKGATVIDRFPPVGFMKVVVPEETFDEDFWYV